MEEENKNFITRAIEKFVFYTVVMPLAVEAVKRAKKEVEFDNRIRAIVKEEINANS